MHTIGKHGPEVSDATLKQRAVDGTDPITGKTPRNAKGSPSSQFNSWKLHTNAINEALTREARGLSGFTGQDANLNDIVRIEQPGAGRGYKPNRRDPENREPLTFYQEPLQYYGIKTLNDRGFTFTIRDYCQRYRRIYNLPKSCSTSLEVK